MSFRLQFTPFRPPLLYDMFQVFNGRNFVSYWFRQLAGHAVSRNLNWFADVMQSMLDRSPASGFAEQHSEIDLSREVRSRSSAAEMKLEFACILRLERTYFEFIPT
jgi:hypothetical protein